MASFMSAGVWCNRARTPAPSRTRTTGGTAGLMTVDEAAYTVDPDTGADLTDSTHRLGHLPGRHPRQRRQILRLLLVGLHRPEIEEDRRPVLA
jgi:hypothetical protein